MHARWGNIDVVIVFDGETTASALRIALVQDSIAFAGEYVWINRLGKTYCYLRTIGPLY